MSIKSVFAALLMASLATPGWSAPATEGAAPGEWTMDLDAAKTLAAQKNLPIFLNFTGSDWCGWCIRMDRQVFSQKAWQDYAKEHFVLVWIDFPRDKSLVPPQFTARNQKLSQEFGVEGYPTYVLLDSDGQTRLGQAGASRDASPESFIESLESIVLASEKSVAALREKLTDAQKTELDAAQSAQANAQDKLQAWIQTDPEQSEENMAAFLAMKDEISKAEKAYLEILRRFK